MFLLKRGELGPQTGDEAALIIRGKKVKGEGMKGASVVSAADQQRSSREL